MKYKSHILVTLIQYSFYPLIVFGCLSFNILLFDYFEKKYFPLIPVILMFVAVIIIEIGERYLPYKKEWQKNRGDAGTDFVQSFISVPIVTKISEKILPILLFYPALWLRNELGISVWLVDAPLLLQLLYFVLMAEFFFYWIHRLTHTNKFLWRFHSVHHASERVYWINSGRFHAFDTLIDSLFYLLPLILFGASVEVMSLFVTLSAITGLLEHANVDFKAGYLNYFFNTAQLHRWHHSIQISEANNNYGKIISIWDIVFGSFYFPSKKSVAEVGIVSKRKVPTTFLGQLTYPFLSQK